MLVKQHGPSQHTFFRRWLASSCNFASCNPTYGHTHPRQFQRPDHHTIQGPALHSGLGLPSSPTNSQRHRSRDGNKHFASNPTMKDAACARIDFFDHFWWPTASSNPPGRGKKTFADRSQSDVFVMQECAVSGLLGAHRSQVD